MKKLLTGAAMALVLCMGPASALAQADAVMDHYRAYDDAMQSGELERAEAAAGAALAASERRDGAGGATARLALNLAQVRLELGRPDAALEPARRTAELYDRLGAGAGVDPALVQLALGRAELSLPGDAGERRLMAVLPTVESRADLRVDAYTAAYAVGERALNQQRYAAASQAFDAAARAAQGPSTTATLSRAKALIGRGIAQLQIDEPTMRAQTGTNIVLRPSREAEDSLAEAARLARPLAERESAAPAVTEAQAAYGAALAWLAALESRLAALGWANPLNAEERFGMVADANAADGLPACSGVLVDSPRPEYPALRGGVGAVAVRLTLNEGGAVTDARVVGVAGGTAFGESVNAVLPQWRMTRPGGQSGGCSQARVAFVAYPFRPERDYDSYGARQVNPFGNRNR